MIYIPRSAINLDDGFCRSRHRHRCRSRTYFHFDFRQTEYSLLEVQRHNVRSGIGICAPKKKKK